MFNANKLQTILDEKGWSRYKLSKESGVAQTTLRDIFGAKQVTPTTKTLTKIALALNVPISSFFNNELEEEQIKTSSKSKEYDGVAEQLFKVIVKLPSSEQKIIKKLINNLPD